MEATINSINGLYIERDTFNKMIVNNKRRWHTREKFPPASNAIANVRVPKTLQHYSAIEGSAAEIVAMARGHKELFDVKVLFADVERFPKNKVKAEDFLAVHQKVCIKEVIERYNKHKYGDILLAMGTGLGKTRLACFITTKVGVKTIVIVPTKHIAEQWRDELEDMYSTSGIAEKMSDFITMYNNKLGDSPKGSIIIVIINTARAKSNKFFAQFGLCIFDEVHELTSNKSKNVLWNSSVVRFRMGLTATPEYTGFGMLPYLEGHLGKTVHANELKGFATSVKIFDVTVRAIKFCTSDSKYSVPILSKSGTVSIMETLSKMLEDPTRTELVVDIINNFYRAGKNILIFAEFRDYLDKISTLLGNKHNIVLKGGVDYKTIREASTTRIILTTYAYSRRGINYDQLNTLVLATPRRNGLKQIIGRILRYKSDVKIPRTIIDIIDCNSVLKSQYYERAKIYKNRDYKLLMV